jgi:hypothetical protein
MSNSDLQNRCSTAELTRQKLEMSWYQALLAFLLPKATTQVARTLEDAPGTKPGAKSPVCLAAELQSLAAWVGRSEGLERFATPLLRMASAVEVRQGATRRLLSTLILRLR